MYQTGTGSSGWKKSSASNSAGCVELKRSGPWIMVRDSKDPAGPQLKFSELEWNAFAAGVRSGELEWENVPTP